MVAAHAWQYSIHDCNCWSNPFFHLLTLGKELHACSLTYCLYSFTLIRHVLVSNGKLCIILNLLRCTAAGRSWGKSRDCSCRPETRYPQRHWCGRWLWKACWNLKIVEKDIRPWPWFYRKKVGEAKDVIKTFGMYVLEPISCENFRVE